MTTNLLNPCGFSKKGRGIERFILKQKEKGKGN